MEIFREAKSKKRTYDALVPLSGGKDSTYVLYLAKKVYGLNVLTYTYDNGFLTDVALKNIKSSTKKLGVDHVFFKPDWSVLQKLYRATLLNAGDMCSVCSLGLVCSRVKMAADWHIPLILLGSSITETGSAIHEPIGRIETFKKVIGNVGTVTKDELNCFLIYPSLNPFSSGQCEKVSGGKVIDLLSYIEKQEEKKIVDILYKELGWEYKGDSTYAKHFDCLAEPFTNYLREHRYGYSRRVCHYSNLIRLGELAREEALRMLNEENPSKEPETTESVLRKIGLPREDLPHILKIKPFRYKDNSTAILSLSIRRIIKCLGLD